MAARNRSKIARRFRGIHGLGRLRASDPAERREAGEASGLGFAHSLVGVERRPRLRGPRLRRRRVAARERDLGQLLVHVAILLAQCVVFRQQVALRLFGGVELAQRALRPRDHPFRDANGTRFASRDVGRQRLAVVDERFRVISALLIRVADVVVERTEPSLRARIVRLFGHRERLHVPVEPLAGRRGDAQHVRRVDRVERVAGAIGERERLGEQRHGTLRRAARIESPAALEEVAYPQVRGHAVELFLDRIKRRVRVRELSLQALRACDLRRRLERAWVVLGPIRELARGSAARRPPAFRRSTGCRASPEKSGMSVALAGMGRAASVITRASVRAGPRANGFIGVECRRHRAGSARGRVRRRPRLSCDCVRRRLTGSTCADSPCGGASRSFAVRAGRTCVDRCRSRAAIASAGLQLRPAGTITMQSTGQGAMQSSHPVQSDGSTACMRFAAPMIASTGQASMQSVQPMHQASSIRATASGAVAPNDGSSAATARPVSAASAPMTTSPPGGHRLIASPRATASA